MTLPAPDLRLLAWQGPFPPCETCARTPNRRCVTSSGALTTPHSSRLKWAVGYDARQSEVDALNAQTTTLLAERESAVQAATEAGQRTGATSRQPEVDALKADLQQASLEVTGLTDQVRVLTRDLAATRAERDTLTKRVAELEKATAPTPPVPPKAKTLFGAGGGNKDRTGDGISLDRRYYGAGDVDKAVADVKRNSAAGITSWVSFKAPFSWVDMTAGKGDAWFDGLAAKLVALGTVVWLSIHHEPEGDADEDDWRTMQDRLSRRVPGGIGGPIKYILTTTGWSQEYNPNRVADEVDWETNLFPFGAPIYAIAYDAPYNVYGYVWANGTKTTEMNTGWTDPNSYVDKLAARAASLGVKAAIGEMGYSDEAFAKDRTWLAKVFDRAIEKGLIGVAYFDTPLNSKRSWTLGAAGSAKRAYFNELVAARR